MGTTYLAKNPSELVVIEPRTNGAKKMADVNTKNAVSVIKKSLIPAGAAIAGGVAAMVITDSIAKRITNPTLSNLVRVGVPMALGTLTGLISGKTEAGVFAATGMYAEGLKNTIRTFAPGLAEKARLADDEYYGYDEYISDDEEWLMDDVVGQPQIPGYSAFAQLPSRSTMDHYHTATQSGSLEDDQNYVHAGALPMSHSNSFQTPYFG